MHWNAIVLALINKLWALVGLVVFLGLVRPVRKLISGLKVRSLKHKETELLFEPETEETIEGMERYLSLKLVDLDRKLLPSAAAKVSAELPQTSVHEQPEVSLDGIHDLARKYVESYGRLLWSEEEVPSSKVFNRILSDYGRPIERDLAQFAPTGAVLAAWAGLEVLLRGAAHRVHPTLDEDSSHSIATYIQILEREGILDRETIAVIDELRTLRNRAAHAVAGEVTSAEAERVLELRDTLTDVINRSVEVRRVESLLEDLKVSSASEVRVGQIRLMPFVNPTQQLSMRPHQLARRWIATTGAITSANEATDLIISDDDAQALLRAGAREFAPS